jgi:hypothetical protein
MSESLNEWRVDFCIHKDMLTFYVLYPNLKVNLQNGIVAWQENKPNLLFSYILKLKT